MGELAREVSGPSVLTGSPEGAEHGIGELPGYLSLAESGELALRADALRRLVHSCALCPRRCRVDRFSGQLGACGVDAQPRVAAMSVHHWEEPPISGTMGSGTIFFTGCTLACVFCQNYPISQMGVGRSMEVEELARRMLEMQRKGVHNINLVTATHQMHAVLDALLLAVEKGFRLPLVYNSSGYEDLDTLQILDGVVDIYLPDMKYSDPSAARRCSGRSDYVEHNRRAVLEMWRQVGPLKVDREGIAFRGLLVRHLVLPGGLSGSRESFAFLASKVGPRVWISLMRQYFPAHKAMEMSPLDRRVSPEEYEEAFALLEKHGLENGFVQSRGEEC